jgi:aryl-alcohol dehydrogenase-like predicted oxidoreductase
MRSLLAAEENTFHWVALAWLLAKPVITAPIVGATKLQHLDDALASVRVRLSEDEMALVEEPMSHTRWSVSIKVGPRSAGCWWLVA